MCVIHSVCLLTQVVFFFWMSEKALPVGSELQEELILSLFILTGGKNTCKLILKTAKCHSKCSERGFIFPSLKTAVIFPDSLMHERQITEKTFVFVELVAGRERLPRSCTYLTSLSVRRSYPCQIAARHSWGWSENEFILGVRRISLC